MPPVVTAVIPCHNHEAWVVDSINSVVSQDHRPLRIVVVDDGSTDRSVERVCEAYGLVEARPRQFQGMVRDAPTILLSLPDAGGPAAARNLGIRVGWEGTDYFALLDSDDLYEPGKIARSLEILEEDPLVGLVYSDFDTLRPDGVRLRQYKEPFGRGRLLRECLPNSDSLIARRVFETVGLFDESLRTCEDYDMWLRISEKFLAVHIAEPLLTIRVGAHSSTATVPTDVWRSCYARVFEKLRERVA